MRIALLASQLAHPATGIGRYTDDCVAGLLRAGADPVVVCTATGVERAEALGVPTDRIVVAPEGVARRSLLEVLGRATGSRSVDVVHGTKHFVPLRGRTATALTVHDTVGLEPPADGALLRRVLLPAAHRRSLLRAGVLLPTNPTVAADLVARLPSVAPRVQTVPVPLANRLAAVEAEAPDGLAERFADTGRFALHVSDLDERKNASLLTTSWVEAVGDEGGVLVLVGERHAGSHPPEGLSELVATGLAVDLGPVRDGQLRWLYENARLTLLPSWNEGFGYPVLEALDLGCPVATAPVPAVDRVGAGHRHLLTVHPPDDRQAWIEAVRKGLAADRAAATPAPGDGLAEFGQGLVEGYERALAARPRP